MDRPVRANSQFVSIQQPNDGVLSNIVQDLRVRSAISLLSDADHFAFGAIGSSTD